MVFHQTKTRVRRSRSPLNCGYVQYCGRSLGNEALMHAIACLHYVRLLLYAKQIIVFFIHLWLFITRAFSMHFLYRKICVVKNKNFKFQYCFHVIFVMYFQFCKLKPCTSITLIKVSKAFVSGTWTEFEHSTIIIKKV